jgi:hypothetical protein
MCSSAIAQITGISPRRGMMSWPRATSTMNNATVAIAVRIAVAQSGKTLCTSVLVTAQFRPQQITTTANNMSAVGRDRE